MKQKLIIVHGQPAAGKTTLSNKLAKDLDVTLVAKDAIKEYFFDTLGTDDREWSKDLGAVTSDLVYMLANVIMKRGKPVILENSFHPSFAIPKINELLKAYDAECLEIYVTVDPAIRKKRFIERVATGERHPGHVDQVNFADLDKPEDKNTRHQLDVGQLVTVDTTNFGDEEYHELEQRVSAFLHS